jgi:hypothetical protein
MFAAVAVGGEMIAVQGTVLDYTVTLTNGKRVIPINSTLDVTANPAANSPITCTTSGNPMPLNGTTSALAADTIVTCAFSVNVTAGHKSSGQVPAITVTAAYGAAAADIIYTIPAATAAAVPVFNGTTTIRKVEYAITGSSKTGAATKGTKPTTQHMHCMSFL